MAANGYWRGPDWRKDCGACGSKASIEGHNYGWTDDDGMMREAVQSDCKACGQIWEYEVDYDNND